MSSTVRNKVYFIVKHFNSFKTSKLGVKETTVLQDPFHLLLNVYLHGESKFNNCC